MNKKIIIAGIMVLGVTMLTIPHYLNALTLTPTSREVTLTAGEKTVSTIQLKNETAKPVQLTTEVVNFTAKNETGEPEFDFKATPTDIATWVTVEKGPIDLAAGATKEIDVVFNTPATATPGGHYVAVFLNEVMTGADKAQVNIESKLGTLFLATVKGTYTTKGSIATFSTTATKSHDDGEPIGFTVRFKNSGQIHLKPTGTIKISNMFGKVVKTITVNADAGATLPGTTRTYSVADWKVPTSAFGKYTVKLTLTADTVTDSASVTFGMISTMGIVFIIVIGIAILAVLMLIIVKATKRKPAAPVA